MGDHESKLIAAKQTAISLQREVRSLIEKVYLSCARESRSDSKKTTG